MKTASNFFLALIGVISFILLAAIVVGLFVRLIIWAAVG